MFKKVTISFYADGSTMSSALNFVFYQLYCNPKEKDHIRTKLNSKKKNICKISIIIISICQKLELVRPIEQKIRLPLPNSSSYEAKELEKPSSNVSLFKLKNTHTHTHTHTHISIYI